MLERIAPHRGYFQLAADCLSWLVGIYVAALLRFDFDLSRWQHRDLLTALAIAVVLHVVVGAALGLYRHQWRFGSFEEMASVAGTTAVVCVATLALNVWAFSPRLVPNGVVVGAALVALVAMGSVRYSWRLYIDRLKRPSADHATRTIIFGAGEAGEQLIISMMRNPESPLYAVAILDDDPVRQRLRIKGVQVRGGRGDLAEVADATDAELLVIAVPSGDADLYRDISRRANEVGLDVSVLPSVQDLLGSAPTFADIRPLEVTDLLGRSPVETNVDQIAGYLKDRRVLVTGAGGSIGSELCRQIQSHNPASLVMIDRDEGALHTLQLALEGHALLSDPSLVVADIRDRARIDELFALHQPQVVFHAAALKHLPLLEMHPDEGHKTNVLGTLNLLQAAAEIGVDHFVNISTDKAANPTSVLGRTKRHAEQLTAWVAERTSGTFLSVRFGNVLGSRGSVLETFRSQIDQGGPVTVVDPDITRYFMTVEEAVQLVIQAGAIGGDGEALVLDMGTPVRIDDVARQLISHSGKDIEIVYTGLRPGEKMHEVLFSPDELGVASEHPMISHVPVPPLDPAEVTQPGLV